MLCRNSAFKHDLCSGVRQDSRGANITIVTRSGTNQFHGKVFEYLRNDIFDANNWFASQMNLPKPEERQNDFGGVLGGPILKNRTFFFFSYQGLRLRLPETRSTTVPSLQARLSALPETQPFLKAFPLPNGPDVGNGASRLMRAFPTKPAWTRPAFASIIW